MKDLYKNVFVHSCWIFILSLCTSPSLFGNASSETLSLDYPESADVDVNLTIHNNGDCPVDIYWWATTGDVYYTTLQAGDQWSVVTQDGEKWRALSSPTDWNNLLFDQSYMADKKANQDWYIKPDYCDTGIDLPPTVSCSGSDTYTWSSNLYLNGTSYSSSAHLICGGNISYTFTLPSEMHNGPITVNIPEYVSADGYASRASRNQQDETWYIEYYKDGNLVGQTNCTEDVEDQVAYAWTVGSLNSVTLPDGADHFKIVHCGCDSGGAQSVHATGVCFEYTVCNPEVTVCNQGQCEMQLNEWLPTGDVFIANIAPGQCETFTGYDQMMLRAVNANPDWSNGLLFDQSITVYGCDNQKFDFQPNYCLPDCALQCPPDVLISCEDSVEPSNTGFATSEGGNCIDPVITYSDEFNGNACPQVITRTWQLDASIATNNPCVPQSVAYWDFAGSGSQNLCQAYGGNPLENGVPATSINGSGCSTGFAVSEVQKDGKSSCVQGAFGGAEAAACVGGQDTNNFENGNSDATKFTVSFGPNDSGRLSDFCFYERATTKNENFGKNWPPSQYGIRVLKNGTEIFKSTGNNTTSSWTQECFDFSNNSDFEYSGATTFKFELLGYAPSEDRSDDDQNIWELDEFNVMACCGDINTTTNQTLTCVQTIEILDNQFPTISNVPLDVTINCSEDIPAVPDDIIAGDNCTFDSEFAETISGDEPCDYVITRTWTAVDACNNTTTESMTITVVNDVDVTISKSPTDAICISDEVVLTADGSGGCAPYTYEWSEGLGTASSVTVTPSADKTYFVTVIDADGCTKEAEITVNVNPNPESGITGEDILCTEATADFSAITPQAGYSYAWDFDGGITADGDADDATETVYWPSTGGEGTKDITLIVTSAEGCAVEYTSSIEIEYCMSIGSTVWLDFNNNGLRDAGEPSVDDKTIDVRLLDANKNVLETQSISDGNYFFDGLAPGDYFVEIDAPVSYPVSSTPTNGGDDQTDDDDNGIQSDSDGDGLTDGPIRSGLITLTPNQEPVGEDGKGGSQDDADDKNGDMTIDFGLVPLSSVGSTIWVDLNNDGIRDAGEPSLDDKKVVVRLLDENKNVLEEQSITDGNYFFDGLLPGNYFVEFDAPDSYPVSSGPTNTSDDQNDDDDNGIQSDSDGDGLTDGPIRSPLFNLTPDTEPVGEPGKGGAQDDAADKNGDMTIDFGVVPLGSIGSTVWLDLNNNGLLDAGEPSANDKTITVRLLDEDKNVLETSTTDADGNYFFGDLLPGDYFVEIDAPASWPVSSTPTDTADNQEDNDDNGIQSDSDGDGLTDGPIRSPLISITPGSEPVGEDGKGGAQDDAADKNGDMTVDFGLVPLSSVGSTIFVDLDNDGVQGPNDPSLDGKTIEVRLLDENKNVLETQTVTDGIYFFDNLLPGNYFVAFDAPDSFPVSSTSTNTNDDGTDNDDNGIQSDSDGDGLTDGEVRSPLFNLTPTTEPSGAEEDGKGGAQDDADDKNGDMTIDFGLVPLGSIGSTVFVDINNNGILDAGEPSADDKTITVRLLDENKNVLETTTTDANGNYFFGELLPGNYFVEIDAPASWPVSSTPTETTDNDVDNDDNGIQSDSDGDGLTDGPIRSPLIALAPGTEPSGADEDGKGGAQDDAEDKNGNMTVDFGLVPLSSVGSTIFVDLDNDGVQGPNDPSLDGKTVQVRLLDENKNVLETQTVTDGIYFFDNLLPGNYYVAFDAPDSFPVSSTTTNTNDDGTDNDDNGIQSDSDGDGLTDGEIRSPLFNLTPSTEPSGADEDGKGGAQDDADDKNGDMTIDFGVVPLGSIGSTVFVDLNNNGLLDAGEPSADDKTITVRLLDEDKNVLETTTTDADGNYFFGDLLPGDYFVEIDAPASWPVSSTPTDTEDNQEDNDDNGIQSDSDGDGLTDGPIRSPLISITPGSEPVGEDGKGGAQDDAADKNGDMTVDFGLVPLSSVGSTIFVDLDNDGIQGPNDPSLDGKTVEVRLLDENKNVLETQTVTDGIYFFDNLLPGNYYVAFDAPDSFPVSSTTTNTNDDGADNDDNGIQSDSDGDGLTDGEIRSPLFNLTPSTEPSGADEDGKGGAQDDADDKNGDMTIDFGVVPLSSIGSTVFIDLNNNGILDAGEPSADDKTITVRLLDENKNVLETTTTDADGNYFFDELLPGNYFVEIDAPDSWPVSSTTTETTDNDVDNDDNGIQSDSDGDGLTDGPIRSPLIELAPTTEPSGTDESGKGGAQDDAADKNGNMTVDFGLVPLSSVGSSIFVDNNNNGILDDGEPSLDGKTVEVRLLDENKNVLETQTVTDGVYFFDNLLPGNYYIAFDAPDSFPVSSTTTNTNDDGTDNDDNGIQSDSDGDGLTDGEVRSPLFNLTPTTEPSGAEEDGKGGAQDDAEDKNGDMTIDFGLVPLSSIGSTVWVDNNNNGILDAGEPSADDKTITVRLLDENKNVLETTTTDADGNYFFDELLPGNYFVEIDAPDSWPVSSTTTNTNDDGTDNDDNGLQSDSDGDGLTDGAIRSPLITLLPGSEPSGADEDGKGGAQDDAEDKNGDMTVDFGLVPLSSVGSTVFIDNNDNGIRDPEDPSVTGKDVTVSLFSADGTPVASQLLGPDGTYFFDNLLPGDYYIEVTPPASLPTSSTGGSTEDDQVDDDDNGAQTDSDGDGFTDGVITSPVFTLLPGSEPVGETGKGGSQDDAQDKNGDMTIDFGLRPTVDISLVKEVTDATPLTGDIITFSIEVTNDGPYPASGISIEDVLPSGYANPTNFSNGGSAAGNVITWTGIDLAVGASQTVTFDVEVLSPSLGGDYNNIAEVTELDQIDTDSNEDNGADTNGNGDIGSEDGDDGSVDADDEDDGDDECVLVIECPADETLECIEDWNASPVTYNSCCEAVVTNTQPTLITGGPNCDASVYEVTYTVEDCVRSTSCVQTITIENAAPTIECPADETVACFDDIAESDPVTVIACNLGSEITTVGPTLIIGTDLCDGAVYTIEYTVTDDCGRSASCTQTFTLDVAPPTIECPADETVACFDDIAETAPVTTTSCGAGSEVTTVGPTLISGTDLCDGAVYTIEYTVTDDCGVTASCTQTFTLDVAPPTIECPADETVACFDDIAESAPVTTTSCGAGSEVTTVGPTLVSGTDLCNGAVYEIVYTVTDDCGVTASCTQTFTLDVAPPTIECPADETVACFDDIAESAPVTTTSCGAGSEVTTVGPTLVSGTDLCDGAVYEIVYTVTDDCGVTASCTQTFTLDVAPPTIECPADETVACFDDIAESAPVTTTSCGAGSEVTTVGPTLVSGTDLCDGAVYEIVYTVTDDCGVTASCTQTFTLDVAPPTIECPADETVACFEDIAEGTPLTTTSCGAGSNVTTVGPTLVDGFNGCDGAIYEIEYTVTDDCGVTASCVQTFTLDVAPPTIECPADETVACFEDIQEGTPVTTAACGHDSFVTTVGPTLISGDDGCNGAVYTIEYTVTDACAVTASCTQTFTLDVAEPTISCPSDMVVECFDNIQAGTPTVITSCDADYSLDISSPILVSGEDACDGAVYRIEYVATDACGVSVSCEQMFTLDMAAPTIECPADETVSCFDEIAEGTPVTTTSCDKPATVTTVGPTLVSGTDGCEGAVYSIEYTVTDDCGASASCTQTFTLDVAAPTIECPADQTVSCADELIPGTPVTSTACGQGSEVTVAGPALVSGSEGCDGAVYEVTYTVTDDCGQSASCVQTWTLDVAAPTIECPADQTVSCADELIPGTPVTTTACGQGSEVTVAGPALVSGSEGCDGAVYEVTYTVTDDCGQSASCVQTWTLDVAAPTIECPADQTVSCADELIPGTPVTTTACGQGSEVTVAGPALVSGSEGCDGAVYEVTYTVTDDCGQSASCVQTWTLDVAAPTIECPADQTVSCADELIPGTPVTTTACDQGSEVTVAGPALVSGSEGCDGAVYEVTYTVTDDCGQSASCVQTWTLDVAAPTIECPADQTVSCADELIPGTPVTTTACGQGSEVTVAGPALVSGSEGCDGAVYEVTYTVTDDCGQSASCVQTWTLDVAEPTISCPSDMVVECFDNIQAGTPTVITSCDADYSLDISSPILVSGEDACDGAVYRIEYVATDACGVSVSCEQMFTLDMAAPTIECPADETVSCFDEIAEGTPVTTTSCDKPATVTTVGPTLVSGTDGCEGAVYSIEYTVTDDCGASASCTQTFTLDVAAPTIECPADQTVSCADELIPGTPVTSTACGQGSEVTVAGPALVSGSEGCDGAVYEVTYTVTDDCGQSASCVQTWTLDVAAPTIECPADQTVSCADELIPGTPVTTTACGQGSEVTVAGPALVSGSEGCDGAVYEVTYTVTDDCGQSASCVQTWTLDVAAPTIECPADQTVSCADELIPGTPVTTTACGQGSEVTVAGPALLSGSEGCDGAVYEVTYTVTDDCGQSASCVQTWTLDVAAPTIECPADQTVSCADELIPGTPVTTTACGQGSEVTVAGPALVSGSEGCDGAVYEVTYTVTDDCGQSASCVQTWTLDVAAPTIECPADQTVSCADELIPGTPVTTTACGQGSEVTVAGPALLSGSEGCDGAVYEVTYTVTDDCGQSASCVQTWTLDVAAPTIECPADQTVSCADELIPGTPVTTTACGQGSEVTVAGPALVSGSEGCDGATYEVTYTVTDDCGQSASCVQTWTLEIAGPSIECPADETVDCFSDISEGTPTVTTECGLGYTVSTNGPTLVSGNDGCDGAQYEIVYTATDDCGKTASCTQTFTLNVAPPTIECPADAMVECKEDITEGIPTTTTSCGQGSTVSTNGPTLVSGVDGCDGAQYEIVYTVTDDCGATASCTQTFTLEVAPPTISCPSDATVACYSDIQAGTPTTTTACGLGSTVTTNGPTLVSGNDGCDEAVYEIEYTVTDDCGATESCVQTFTLDVAPPTIECPADATITCIEDALAGTPITTTACGHDSEVTTVGPTLTSGTPGCDGATYEVEYTITDDCGATASCTQTFTIEVDAPEISCPADATVGCFDEIVAGTATGSTQCQLGYEIEVSEPNLISGTAECNGSQYVIVYTITDDCGEEASCAQTFTLSVGSPTISCPADQVVECYEDIAEGTATVTIACGLGSEVTTVGPTFVSGNEGCDGAIYEIVYTVTDDCGETASCTQTFTLNTAAPTISCPADAIVSCVDDIQAGTPTTDASCGIGTEVTTNGPTLVSGDAGCDGAQYQIVYTVTDDCGRTASCTQSFLLDVAAPTISCPADAQVACMDDISAGSPTTSVACGGNGNVTTSGPTLVSGNGACDGAIYEIVYTVTDDCGQSASCTQTFTFITDAPTISCPADQNVTCVEEIAAGTATTTAACGQNGNVTTSGPTLVSGNGGCDGAVYEIVYTVTDECGQSASCTQSFFLNMTGPSITCPADATVGCGDDIVAGTPTTSASCGAGIDVTTVGPTLVSGTAGCAGAIYEIVYTATDDCGLSASCTQTITVDGGATSITCPADVIVSCVDDIVAGTATTTAACGTTSDVTTSGPTLVSGNAGCAGAIYEITYTATDDCGGSASCTQSFTIEGSAPTISCPADLTVECADEIQAGTATTTGSCGNGTNVSTTGPTFVSGTPGCTGAIYEIVYTVTDDCGQSASCAQTFTLQGFAPSISCPADATVSCVDDIAAGTATTTGSCGAIGTVTTSGPTLISGTAGCDGAIYEIVYTATDACGAGDASCTQTFTLNVGAPTITCPADATVTCLDDVIAGNATSSSNCSMGSNITSSAPTLTGGTAGCTGAIYEITYTATDDCGGSASCTQRFTLDVPAPTISCPADATVSCVDDIVAGTATTSANCALGSNVTTSAPTLVSGNAGCTGAVYQITYTASDDCGGSASCTQNFTLNAPAPSITCPADATVSCIDDVVAGTATGSANCALGSNITSSTPALISGTAGCTGAIYEITYTATDDCGGSATCTQQFTLDIAAPTITCPADATVACADDIVAGTPTTNASCNMGSSFNTFGPTLVSGSEGCPGAIYEIVYEVTDACSGFASCIQTFTLAGDAPTISCPADQTVACADQIIIGTPTTTTGSCTAGGNVTTSGPTLVSGTDGCTGAIYEVTYTLDSDCGGSSSCTQSFTIDAPAPTITCPEDVTITCIDDFVAGTPTIETTCGAANGSFTVSEPVLTSGTAGCFEATYAVTYSYFDSCSGADLSCTQTVTLDYAGFKIHCPEDVTVADDISNWTPGVPDYIGACGPVSLVVSDPVYLGPGGPCKDIFIATYSATDECGNTVICTQEIGVETDCVLNMGNRVFNDMNNNGVEDAGDDVMANMRVNLWLETTGDNMPDEFVKWTTTDANGEYMFYDIQPGDYIVEIPESELAHNCIPSTNNVVDPDNDMDNMNDAYDPGISGMRVMTYPVTIDYETEPMDDGDNDSNTNLTVDIGLIHTSSLGSFVWEDLDSDGIQDAGEQGFNGVIVRLFNVDNPTVAVDMVTTANDPVSGNDGYFMFTGVIPGSYFVTFELPNGYIFTTPGIGSDTSDSDVDGTNGDGSTGVIYIGQDEINITVDAGIYAASAIGNYVWIDHAGGAMNVADGGDQPLEGVEIVLWDAINNVVVGNTTSDVNGSYLFSDIPAGDYYVEFKAPSGYSLIAPNIGGDDTMDSDADPITRLSHTVTIEAGDTNLTIDAGFSVTVDVDLVTFDGSWNNARRISELFWITASEINTEKYILERSDLNDNSFREIGEVYAEGNTSSETRYEYEDETIVKGGTYYYRLQIVDNNGSISYSDVIAIDVTDLIDRPQVDLRIYPHATSDILNLEVTTSERFEVSGEVYDMKGALISPLSLNAVTEGTNSLQVNVDSFTAGAYIIRLKVGNKVFVERFTKID